MPSYELFGEDKEKVSRLHMFLHAARQVGAGFDEDPEEDRVGWKWQDWGSHVQGSNRGLKASESRKNPNRAQ